MFRGAIVSLIEFSLDHSSTFWVDYYATRCGIVYLSTLTLEIACDKAFKAER